MFEVQHQSNSWGKKTSNKIMYFNEWFLCKVKGSRSFSCLLWTKIQRLQSEYYIVQYYIMHTCKFPCKPWLSSCDGYANLYSCESWMGYAIFRFIFKTHNIIVIALFEASPVRTNHGTNFKPTNHQPLQTFLTSLASRFPTIMKTSQLIERLSCYTATDNYPNEMKGETQNPQ